MRLRLLAASAALAVIGLLPSTASAQCGPSPNINAACWATFACVDPGSLQSSFFGRWRVINACYTPDRTDGQPCTWVDTPTGESRQVQCEAAAPTDG